MGVDCRYKGRSVVESQVRKQKHIHSYSRMFKDYDDKYLSLNLIDFTLTYRKRKESNAITHIPLKSVSQVEFRVKDGWEHFSYQQTLVITCTKRNYYFQFFDRNNIMQFAGAFQAIVDTFTLKTAFLLKNFPELSLFFSEQKPTQPDTIVQQVHPKDQLDQPKQNNFLFGAQSSRDSLRPEPEQVEACSPTHVKEQSHDYLKEQNDNLDILNLEVFDTNPFSTQQDKEAVVLIPNMSRVSPSKSIKKLEQREQREEREEREERKERKEREERKESDSWEVQSQQSRTAQKKRVKWGELELKEVNSFDEEAHPQKLKHRHSEHVAHEWDSWDD